MKNILKKFVLVLGITGLAVLPEKSFAFALLGPFQPWMQPTNGVILPGDIGGPMSLGSGYRWNVPVLTYGFDQSFLNYFGTNGVAAVQSAIQILNDLPSASNLVLTNYPFETQQLNFIAQAQSLLDLKSQTLTLLLEHMGLAPPTRNIFVLRQWTPQFISGLSPNEFANEQTWEDWAYPMYISQLNFDPQTLAESHYVNGTIYSADMSVSPSQNYIIPFTEDIYADSYTAVADNYLDSGGYYYSLTYDDVGGLADLLSTNTINFENLLPGVAGTGSNANNFVNGAWRPGVDKICFVPQPADPISGNFLPLTNNFTDSYFTNGILMQQSLARITTQPDFLFSVGDIISPGSLYCRTGTTNWINNAIPNHNTNGDGPGVIQPPVKITLQKMNHMATILNDQNVYDYPEVWSSFDGSTNPPVIYPVPGNGTNSMTVHLWLGKPEAPLVARTFNPASGVFDWSQIYWRFDWNAVSSSNTSFAIQTTTDLVNWTNLFTFRNDGNVASFYTECNPSGNARFYRIAPQ